MSKATITLTVTCLHDGTIAGKRAAVESVAMASLGLLSGGNVRIGEDAITGDIGLTEENIGVLLQPDMLYHNRYNLPPNFNCPCCKRQWFVDGNPPKPE